MDTCEDCTKPADFIVRDNTRGWGNTKTPARLICRPCLATHDAHQAQLESDPFWRDRLPVITVLRPEHATT